MESSIPETTKVGRRLTPSRSRRWDTILQLQPTRSHGSERVARFPATFHLRPLAHADTGGFNVGQLVPGGCRELFDYPGLFFPPNDCLSNIGDLRRLKLPSGFSHRLFGVDNESSQDMFPSLKCIDHDKEIQYQISRWRIRTNKGVQCFGRKNPR